MDDEEINVAVRAVQDEFKASVAADDELFHETCQAALRSVVRHLRNGAQPQDDEPEYVRYRREQGFYHYECH